MCQVRLCSLCLCHSYIQEENLAPLWDMLLSWGKEKEQWPSHMMALKASARTWHLSLLPTFRWLKLHVSGQRPILPQGGASSHVTMCRAV